MEELVELLAWAADGRPPVAPVGLGSNLLVADEGFAGLALKLAASSHGAQTGDGPARRRAEARPSPSASTAPAPPGSAGSSSSARSPERSAAAVWMNAGAYGSDIAGVLEPRARRGRGRCALADAARSSA